MSYDIPFSTFTINFSYDSLQGLIDPATALYFIQIIADNKTYNYSDYGIPEINYFEDKPIKNITIMTVFGDNTNIILMPVIHLNDTNPYTGSVLYAYSKDNNSQMLHDITSINSNNLSEDLPYMILDKIDSYNNFINTPGSMGATKTYLIYSNSYTKLLALSMGDGPDPTYQDTSLNYIIQGYQTDDKKIPYLYISRQIYEYFISYLYGETSLSLLKGTMVSTASLSTDSSSNSSTDSSTLTTLYYLLAIFIILIVIAVIVYYGYKSYKNSKKYSKDIKL